jgi:hypothetical protein
MSVVHFSEDIECHILEVFISVNKVLKYFIIVLSKAFILRMTLSLGHFVSKNLSDYVNQYIFKSQFITIFILNASRELLVLSSLLIGFLLHNSNAFIGCFNLNCFNISSRWNFTIACVCFLARQSGLS